MRAMSEQPVKRGKNNNRSLSSPPNKDKLFAKLPCGLVNKLLKRSGVNKICPVAWRYQGGSEAVPISHRWVLKYASIINAFVFWTAYRLIF